VALEHALVHFALAYSLTSAHCFARGGPPSFKKAPLSALQHALTPYSSAEKAGLARREDFATWGRGYRHEQATRPQTLGYSLADSLVGLLAWIYEKLVQWTDGYPWTDDEGDSCHHGSSE
jgi:hypothetical protein